MADKSEAQSTHHTTPTTYRDYIGSRLVGFAQAHEHVKVTTELKRNAHPVVQADYGTCEVDIRNVETNRKGMRIETRHECLKKYLS